MASRNGLNPKIKGPKGAGFGRALPSAFGFDNGIKPDGVDDYLQIPSLIGKAIPHFWTIEFWVYMDTPMPSFQGWIEIHDNSGSGEMRLQGQPDSVNDDFQFIGSTGGIVMGLSSPGKCIRGAKNHIILTFDIDGSAINCILNGNISTKVSEPVSKVVDPYLGTFQLFNLFVLSSQGLYSNKLVDEFRMYSEVLSNEDIVINYNQGIGGNPCKTENLFVWYKFEEFENLDFSTMQDGSDIRLGVRDLSMKNNHAQPFNMDTNPTSETYALQTF
jgi:hypothetical protein